MIRTLFIHIMLDVFLLCSKGLYSQPTKLDSLTIRYMGAVKLCDSVNTQLPDTIRIKIIKYLDQNGFNPEEFFTTKRSMQKNNDGGYVGLLKIGALRDLYNIQFTKEKRVYSDKGDDIVVVEARVGAAGGYGDDIVVVFDKKFRDIKRITNSE